MAYDRIIRASLLESDRWIDLHTDTARLVYAPLLLLRADDFGNLEGGGVLMRYIKQQTQLKLDQDVVKVMSELQDADLARRYEVLSKEYWHLPRFKNARRYTSRICPMSPWCNPEILSTVERLRKGIKDNTPKPAADMPQASGRTAANMLRGVGVGVGVGENHHINPSTLGEGG